MQRTILDSSHGKYFYRVGSAPNVNYMSHGGSDDWVRGNLGVKWVYLLELPDRKGGPSGFRLPSSQIIPTAYSVFHAFRSGALAIQNSIVR